VDFRSVVRERWHSSLVLRIGLVFFGVATVLGTLASVTVASPGSTRALYVTLVWGLAVVTIVFGSVIVATRGGAHSWVSGRKLSEELGMTLPSHRDDPWLRDVIERGPPPP
jgi:hypothetical protein